MADPLRIYFVVGEMSGDTLGAELLDAFEDLGVTVEPIGLGGAKLADKGLKSLFDISEISVMGISGVIAKLPKLLRRAAMVSKDVLEKRPDVLVLVDSPDFCARVAKRVKKKFPDLLVIKYVCPSVWAWREARARKMKAYIDHILALLPFEPKVLAELDGPKGTYVGHPLAKLIGKVDIEAKRKVGKLPNVVLMPGSRKSEVKRLLPILERTVDLFSERGNNARFVIPAVDHLKDFIRSEVDNWALKIEIVTSEEVKLKEFTEADLAIAASGTAILELAMYGVPAISIYKPDPALNAVRFLIKAWTAALPNLIADQVIVPERINEFAHPGYICRLAEGLLRTGHERDAQIDGFQTMFEQMTLDEKPAIVAAKAIMQTIIEKSKQ